MGRTRSVNGKIETLTDDENTAFTAEQVAFTQENAINEVAQAHEDTIQARMDLNARTQAITELTNERKI